MSNSSGERVYWECTTADEAVGGYAHDREKALEALAALRKTSKELGNINADDALLIYAVTMLSVSDTVRGAVFKGLPEAARDRIDDVTDDGVIAVMQALAPIYATFGTEVVIRILAEGMLSFLSARAEAKRLATN